VQLLFVLRDPVERIYSQYRYALHRGEVLPGFEQLLAVDHDYLEWAIYVSTYHLHLTRFLEFFSRQQVLVFLYDDWRGDPQAFTQSIYRAVGADPEFVSPNLEVRYNPTQRARLPWLQRALGVASRKVMVQDLPPWLFATLRGLRSGLWRLNSAQAQAPALDPQTRQRLIDRMAETIEFVEAYLDRPLPAWRKA
jgi:hypothetical protein